MAICIISGPPLRTRSSQQCREEHRKGISQSQATFRGSTKPIGSMYGINTYIYHENQPNVGKYTIHGTHGKKPHPDGLRTP